MAEKLTVGELVYKISGDMDNLKTEVKKSEKEIKRLEKTIEDNQKATTKMSKAFGIAKTAIVGFVSGALVRGIYQLAQSGSELQTLSNSFRQLTANLNLNSEEVLTSLKNLSGGTIANKDLVAAANRAMVLGVAEDMDEFSTLMQTARLRARDMGITTTQAFDNIVTGIGRGSPLILDNLGFIVSATQAQEEYAKKLGVTADQLTEAQKKEALKNSILTQGNKEIEAAGEITANYADRLAQASTFVTNLKDNIGRALLPAMASLLDATLEGNQGFLQSTEDVNRLGKVFYQVGQGLIVVGKGLSNGFRIIVGAVQHFVLKTAEQIQTVLKVANKATDALGLNSEKLQNGLQLTNDFIADLEGRMGDNLTAIEDNSKDLTDALGQVFDPTEYQGLSDGELASLMTDVADSTAGVGAAAVDAETEVEDFTDKLISLRDEAVKTRQELEDKLKQTFEDFSKGLKDNIEESVTSLAEVVLAAEKSKAEIKDALKSRDLSADDRKELKAQLKEQEAILKSRKDFEERQAEQIAGIRSQLEEAGIDAAKAGLDGLLDVRSLEAQLEEDRRVASLNEFQRQEEAQAKKLESLVNAFITEATLQKEKIDQQKAYEEEVTTFLLNEDEKRLANTQAWASKTLTEYGKLASSLRSLISQQERLNALRSGRTSSRSTPSTSNYSRSTVYNNSRTVNAPITVNNSQSQRGTDLGREIAWELGRK